MAARAPFFLHESDAPIGIFVVLYSDFLLESVNVLSQATRPLPQMPRSLLAGVPPKQGAKVDLAAGRV